MVSLGSAMKALTAMMRGKQAYDAERVKASAKTIAGHGGESMTSLFPEGSLKHPSRAKPAIWADWDRFSALATQLAVYAGALASAAANQRLQGRVGTAVVERMPARCRGTPRRHNWQPWRRNWSSNG